MVGEIKENLGECVDGGKGFLKGNKREDFI